MHVTFEHIDRWEPAVLELRRLALASQERCMMLTDTGEPLALQLLGPPEEENSFIPQDERAILRCLLDLNNPTIAVNEAPEDEEEVEVNLFKEFGENSGNN